MTVKHTIESPLATKLTIAPQTKSRSMKSGALEFKPMAKIFRLNCQELCQTAKERTGLRRRALTMSGTAMSRRARGQRFAAGMEAIESVELAVNLPPAEFEPI